MAQNGFYISNNKDSDLYFNSLIEQPDVYINLDSIVFDKSQSTTSVTPSNIEAPQITLSDYLKDITLPNGISRENLEKAISDKLTGITLSEDNIRSVLENKFVIVQTDTGPQPVFIHYEADKINVTYIDNNNIGDFGEKIVFKLNADNATKEEFKTDSTGGMVSVSVTNDGIQIHFGNSIYLINNDELNKTEVESKSVEAKINFDQFINDIKTTEENKGKTIDETQLENLKDLIEAVYNDLKDLDTIPTNTIKNTAKNKIPEGVKISKEYGLKIVDICSYIETLFNSQNNNVCLS